MALESGIQMIAPNELMRNYHSFLDAASVTSSSAMNTFLVGNMTGMVIMVKATSVAGTPNYTLSLQTAFEDVSATFTDVDAISRPNFAAINDELWHVYTVNFVNCMQYARFYITLNGGDGGDDVFYFKACALYGSLTHATDVTIEAGSISIGAIKLEDGTTTSKAVVNATNTARTTATNVLVVQHVDAAGNVLPSTATAFSVDQSAALEASSVSKASAGRLYKVSGRIDSSIANGTYYIQLLDAAALPADGAVTHIVAPIKIIHVSGTDSFFDLDLTGNDLYSGVAAASGIVIVSSSTEFTKTITAATFSATALYV